MHKTEEIQFTREGNLERAFHENRRIIRRVGSDIIYIEIDRNERGIFIYECVACSTKVSMDDEGRPYCPKCEPHLAHR